MESYTILEYNAKDKRYREVGHAEAKNSKEAIDKFVEEKEYVRRKDVVLFARLPVCR